MDQITRMKTIISLNENNPFKTNFIYIKHSYLVFLFAFFISIIAVLLSRLLISNNNNNTWEEAIGQIIFDSLHRISYTMIMTCGWFLYDKKKIKCIHNLLIAFTQIFDGIISFVYWGNEYGRHSTLRWDETYITNFDKMLARIRYSLYGITVISYYFYYYPDIKNIRNNWTIKKSIYLFYMLVEPINLLITFGEGYYSLYIFSCQILFFMLLVSFDIFNKNRTKNSHTHMGILITSLISISYYLPKVFLFLFNLMDILPLKMIIFISWEISLIILFILINKLINLSLSKNVKTLMLFPFIFSIEFYIEFIFLDSDFFTIPFFLIFIIKFMFEIINDTGIINFIQNKIHNIYNKKDNIINDLKIIKEFTVSGELNFFSERLALFVILIFILIDYIFDIINIFILNQKIDKYIKLHILLGYLFIFGMGLISNILTTYLRSKIYNYYYQRLEYIVKLEKINEEENRIDNSNIDLSTDDINSKFELSEWKISRSFVFFIISYLIINGIESSPLYK